MSASLVLAPGDSGYDEVYARWVRDGRAEFAENLSAGWQYRAIRPDATASQPTFTLVSSQPLTDPDRDGPPAGYTRAMGTRQSSLPGGQRTLPRS